MKQRRQSEPPIPAAVAPARVLDLLYGEGAGADGGQVRALAALAEAQTPVPVPSRYLLSHDTRAAIAVYRKAKRDGSAISIPLLDKGGPAAMAARWGADYLRPRFTLNRLRARSRLSLVDEGLARWIFRESGENEKRWRNLNTFGLVADAYLTDLLLLRRLLEKGNKKRELRALNARLTALVDPASVAALDALPRDRGLLICGTHAGTFRFGYDFLHAKFPDMAALAGGEVDRKRSEADRVGAIFAMTKHLRKPGTVALIGADGRNGASTAPIRVRDLEVPVRLGAPTVMFNARCAGVFYLTKWVDERLVVECVAAPAVEPGVPFAEWSARWLDAYGAVITGLLAGNPANVHGTWGIWRSICEALGAKEHAAA